MDRSCARHTAALVASPRDVVEQGGDGEEGDAPASHAIRTRTSQWMVLAGLSGHDAPMGASAACQCTKRLDDQELAGAGRPLRRVVGPAAGGPGGRIEEEAACWERRRPIITMPTTTRTSTRTQAARRRGTQLMVRPLYPGRDGRSHAGCNDGRGRSDATREERGADPLGRHPA